MKLISKFGPVCLVLTLSGCGLPPIVSALSYAIEGASYAASGKSVSDHALSAAASQDCAMFRIVSGEEVCRDETGDDTAVLAMVDTPETGVVTPSSPKSATPVVYSYGIAADSGWAISAGADIAAGQPAAAVPASPKAADGLIRPGSGPVGTGIIGDPADSAALSRIPSGLPAALDLFALVQENGTLELFAYDPSRDSDRGRLILVASIAGYSDDPSLFTGISRGGQFIGVEDLIV